MDMRMPYWMLGLAVVLWHIDRPTAVMFLLIFAALLHQEEQRGD